MPRRKSKNNRRREARAVPTRQRSRWGTALVVGGVVSVAVLIAILLYPFLKSSTRDDAPNAQADTAATVPPALPYEVPARPELPMPDNEPGEQAAIVSYRNQSFDVAEELVKALPNSADAVSVLATVHHRHANEKVANSLWHACLKIDPQCADAHHMLGTTAISQGDYAEAVTHLRQALQLDPEWTAIPLPLADALSQQGEFREAAEVLERYCRKVPGDVQAWCQLGESYQHQEDYEKARSCFLRALEIDTDSVDACYALSILLRILGNDADAAAYSSKFRDLKQSRDRALSELRPTIDEVWRMRSTLLNTHMTTARVYIGHRMLQAAMRHCERAATLEPKHRESRELLCAIHVARRDAAAALRVRQELCRITPDDTRQWLRVGMLSYEMGDMEQAERAFRRLIELAPDRAEGYLTLAQILMQPDKNPSEAVRLAEKGIELSGTAPNYHVLAAVHENAGDIKSARRALAQAMRLDPGNAKYENEYRRLQHER